MRVLAIDSAVGRCTVAYVDDGAVTGEHQDAARGQPGILAAMTERVLRRAGLAADDLDLIAVTVGPGSFTGIRSALALAHGLGMAAARPVVGITVGEALREALPFLGHRTLWTAVPSRPGRVFIEIGASIVSVPAGALPAAPGPIAVAGTAAADVASRLAARSADVMLTDAQFPGGLQIAQVAVARHRGERRPLPAEPLYVDAPEAKLPPPRAGALSAS